MDQIERSRQCEWTWKPIANRRSTKVLSRFLLLNFFFLYLTNTSRCIKTVHTSWFRHTEVVMELSPQKVSGGMTPWRRTTFPPCYSEDDQHVSLPVYTRSFYCRKFIRRVYSVRMSTCAASSSRTLSTPSKLHTTFLTNVALSSDKYFRTLWGEESNLPNNRCPLQYCPWPDGINPLVVFVAKFAFTPALLRDTMKFRKSCQKAAGTAHESLGLGVY